MSPMTGQVGRMAVRAMEGAETGKFDLSRWSVADALAYGCSGRSGIAPACRGPSMRKFREKIDQVGCAEKR